MSRIGKPWHAQPQPPEPPPIVPAPLAPETFAIYDDGPRRPAHLAVAARQCAGRRVRNVGALHLVAGGFADRLEAMPLDGNAAARRDVLVTRLRADAAVPDARTLGHHSAWCDELADELITIADMRIGRNAPADTLADAAASFAGGLTDPVEYAATLRGILASQATPWGESLGAANMRGTLEQLDVIADQWPALSPEECDRVREVYAEAVRELAPLMDAAS